MNELEYLIKQLDLIIGFLNVSDEEVYNQIKNHDKFDFGISIDNLYEGNFENFRNHITASSLILGFSHFEDFISKMVAKIFLEFPSKNKIKFTISKFQELGSDYIKILGEEQAKELTLAEKMSLIKDVYKDLDNETINQILLVNKIRNCLMHNNGYADKRLLPQYANGEKISLTSGQIHGYGIKIRDFANELWEKINI